jgi:hypothetical protein
MKLFFSFYKLKNNTSYSKSYCYAKATTNVITVESTINTNQNVIVKSSNFKCIL